MRLSSVSLIIGLSALGACRSSSTKNPDASPDSGGGTRIQDIQNDMMPVGMAVELHGVVVTAIDTFGAKTGDIWVEEPEGGAFSGIHVFGAPVAQVTPLALGDIVDITGAVKDEFALMSDTSGRTVTELKPAMGGMITVTKTGTGTVPAPQMVDAFAIGTMPAAQRDAEWEKWEGVLITVKTTSGGVTAGNVNQVSGTMPDPTLQNFSITGVAKVESSLAAFPMPAIKAGDCLASVTGVEDYFFDYLILPRTTSEVATGGTGCPPRETATPNNLCTDGMDNDANGFSDCMDLGCEVGAGAWLGTSCTASDTMCGCSMNLTAGTSVNKVNTGTTGPVILNNVFVTAVAGSGFWIADALQAAPNGGVFVFTGAAPAAGIVVGVKLATVQGLAGPFGKTGQKVIEVSNATAGAISAGGVPLPITNATAAQLGDLANGGQYAGSLVQLSNLKVMTAADAHNQLKLIDNNGSVITMDDGAFKNYSGTGTVMAPAVGTCFKTLTGVMDLQTTDQLRTINPRSATDMISVGGTCN